MSGVKKAVVILYCAVLLLALALCVHAAFDKPRSGTMVFPDSAATVERI